MIYQLSFWIVYLSLHIFGNCTPFCIYPFITFFWLPALYHKSTNLNEIQFLLRVFPIRPQHFHTQLGQTTALDLLRPCSIRKMWTAAVCSNPVGTEEPHIWFLEEKRTTSVKGMITMAESERNICSSCSHPASLLWEAPVGHVAPNQSIWR